MCAKDVFVSEMEKRKEKKRKGNLLPQTVFNKRTIKVCVRFTSELLVVCLYASLRLNIGEKCS